MKEVDPVDVEIRRLRAEGNEGHAKTIQANAELANLNIEYLDEIHRLREVANESNAVCACGCDEHENYGEDGMSCAKNHECVPTSRAVLSILDGLRDFPRSRTSRIAGDIKDEQVTALRASANNRAHEGFMEAERYKQKLMAANRIIADHETAMRAAVSKLQTRALTTILLDAENILRERLEKK